MTLEVERSIALIEKKARRNYHSTKMAIHVDTAVFMEKNGFEVICPPKCSWRLKEPVKVTVCWDNPTKKNTLADYFNKMGLKHLRRSIGKIRSRRIRAERLERKSSKEEEKYACLECIYDDVCEDCSGHRCPLFSKVQAE